MFVAPRSLSSFKAVISSKNSKHARVSANFRVEGIESFDIDDLDAVDGVLPKRRTRHSPVSYQRPAALPWYHISPTPDQYDVPCFFK